MNSDTSAVPNAPQVDVPLIPSDVEDDHGSCSIELENTFRYESLPWDGNRNIRLMKISNENDNGITVCIQHFSLALAPDFTAVSYVWGDAERSYTISANGEHLSVTYSLYTFLEEATRRIKRKDDCSRAFHGWIWIDAACIDQSNIEERAEQIRHMPEIYETATNIIIWLGMSDDGRDKAMQTIERLSAVKDDRLIFGEVKNNSHYNCEFVGDTTVVQMHTDDLLQMQRLMYSNVYWSRAWIFQEASTPKDDTSWICVGSISILYSAFSLTNRRLNYSGWQNKQSHMLNLHEICSGSLLIIDNVRQLRAKGAYIGDLWSLLMQTLSFRCSDPRDKVYAVLGLASDRNDLLMEPSYSINTRDVFIELSATVIMRYMSLDCLGSAAPVKSLDLPGWVADWAAWNHGEPTPFATVCRVLDDRGALSSETKLYDTSKDIRPKIEIDSAVHTLSTNGFCFDAVEKTSCIRAWPEGDLDAVWSDWSSIVQDLPAIYLTGDSILETFAKVLTADCKDIGLANGWSATRGSCIDDFPSLEINLMKRHAVIIDQVTWNRRLFITQKGYLGIAAADIIPSDVVCVIGGSTMPLILRLDGSETCQFVAQAYVHGIMDGEAVTTTDLVGSIQTFSIR